MTSLGDVYLDVHANIKALPGEVRRGAKKIGPEGERAGKQYGAGFNRGFSRSITGVSDRLDATFSRRGRSRILNFFRFAAGGAAKLLLLPFRIIGKLIDAAVDLGKAFVSSFREANASGQAFFRSMLAGFTALGTMGAAAVTNFLLNANPVGLIVALVAVGVALSSILVIGGPLATVLVGLTAAVTALAASLSFALVGAVGALVAIMGPAIAGLGVLGLAFIGMSDKAKKAAKEAFKPLRNELKQLQTAARGPLLKALPGIVKNLEGPFKRLRPLIRGISRAIGDVGLSFAKGFKTPGFKAFRDSMEKFLPFAIRRLGDIARQTLGGLGGIFRGMVPFMKTVLTGLDNLTARFSEWANSAEGQTSIQNFFKDVAASSKIVLGLLKSVGSLLKTVFAPGRIAGDNIIQSLAANIQKFSDYLRANPTLLADFFASGIATARVLGSVFVGLMKLLGLLAVSAGVFFKAIGHAAIAMSYLAPGLGFLRDIGRGLVDTGNQALGMRDDIAAATAAIQNLGNTDGTPKLKHESFKKGAERLKAEGRTVAQVMQEVKGPYTPVINPPKIEKVKTAANDIIRSITKLMPFANKKGGSIPPIKVPFGLGKFTGPSLGKAISGIFKGGAKAAKVAWSLAPKPSGGVPKLSGGKKVTVPWKWGKAPKFPKITGGDLKVKIAGTGAFDKAKNKAKQLTSALKATDKIDPNIKIKDNAGTAKSHINSVRSALSRLNGKTSHVYIVTHKKTVGGYMGGPAPSAMSFARGGKLPGSSPNDPTIDNLRGFVGRSPIMLRSGEFIMNEPATKMFQPMLEAMNRAGNKSIGIPGRAAGGSVDTPLAPPASPVGPTDAQMRRQAELNAKALQGSTFRLDKQGNLKLLSLGG